jgi:hypothetical protein
MKVDPVEKIMLLRSVELLDANPPKRPYLARQLSMFYYR